MEHYYSYTAIITNKSDRDIRNEGTYDSWFKTTAGYKNLVAYLNSIFYAYDLEKDYSRNGFDSDATMFIDVMTPHNKKRRKLEKIIELAEKNPHDWFTLCVPNVSVIGNTAKEIKERYHRFAQLGNIGTLIVDYAVDGGLSEYSLCDFSLKYRDNIKTVLEKIDLLQDGDISKRTTYKGTSDTDFSENFIDAYFLFEAFQIPEDVASKIAGLSPVTFHSLSDKMAQLVNLDAKELPYNGEHYSYSELQQLWFDKNGLSYEQYIDLPKRAGKVIKSETIDEIIKLKTEYDELSAFYKKCTELGLPTYTDIDINKYKKKVSMSRKEMAQYLKLYDTVLIGTFSLYEKQCEYAVRNNIEIENIDISDNELRAISFANKLSAEEKKKMKQLLSNFYRIYKK